jgi:hypothetical protein
MVGDDDDDDDDDYEHKPANTFFPGNITKYSQCVHGVID